MPDFASLISTVPPHCHASLWPAPANARMPPPVDDPHVCAVNDRLLDYHLAALITLYGPVPSGVTLQKVIVSADDTRVSSYFATISEDPAFEELEWFHGFEAGLTNWDEAAFPDPLVHTPLDAADPEGHGDLSIMSMAEIETHVSASLRKARRYGDLANFGVALQVIAGQSPDP